MDNPSSSSMPDNYATPVFSSIPAGFPSPAEDYLDNALDLNERLIRHPAATFFVRVKGDSMVGAGIFSGDILVVDRSLEARSGSIVIAILNGEFMVRRLQRTKTRVTLCAENPKYKPTDITPDMDFEIWGVVIHCIRSFIP